MADVTGPISSLPGSSHFPPENTVCDTCGKPATIRKQGDTDSFGAEMFDFCKECWEKAKEDFNASMLGSCDWCKAGQVELSPRRDYEEGMAGRVYYVCSHCIDKDVKRINEEYDQEFGFNDYYEDDYEDTRYNDLLNEIDSDFEQEEPAPNFKVFFFRNGEKFSEEVYSDTPSNASIVVRKYNPGAIVQKIKAIKS
jgi:hypothetical protein